MTCSICSTCNEVIPTDKWVFVGIVSENCEMFEDVIDEDDLAGTTNYFNYFNQDTFLKNKYCRYKCPKCGTEFVFEDRRSDRR